MDTTTSNRRTFCKGGCGAILGGLALSCLSNLASAKGEDDVAGEITSVTARVISQKGTCGAGHKVGDVVRFTETGVEGKICIHALYSMMPAVFAMMFDAKFPWLKDPDRKTHPCTDIANPVVFEISRNRA